VIGFKVADDTVVYPGIHKFPQKLNGTGSDNVFSVHDFNPTVNDFFSGHRINRRNYF